MVTVYVLKSILTGINYVGMTKNIDNRLKAHNAGKSKFTSHAKPWKIIYTESCEDFANGRVREKYLKSAAGKSFLKKILASEESLGSLPE